MGQESGRGLKGIRNEGGRRVQILQEAKKLRVLEKPTRGKESRVARLLNRGGQKGKRYEQINEGQHRVGK